MTTQPSSTVHLDIDSRGVAFVTLKRPEVHNAINPQLIEEMLHIIHEIGQNKAIRLLVLQGDGRSFSAGADLAWMKSMKDASQSDNLNDSKKLAELFDALNQVSCPMLCKVQGGALGGGAGLVAVADYVLAAQDTIFAFSEVRLGLVPAVISPYVLAKIGESHARALFLSGMRFSAERAKEIGLVHEVVQADTLDTRLEQLIKEFLKAAPVAAMEAKQLIRDVLSISDEKARVEHCCKKIAALRVSQEGQEGMDAMLNKRNPIWASE